MISSLQRVNQYLNYLDEHFRRYYVSQGESDSGVKGEGFIPLIDEPFVVSLIEAVALRAPNFLLPTRFVHMVDERLIPCALRLSNTYRGELSVALVLQLFQVAGETFTNLERGWRRVQVAKIAFGCKVYGLNCGEDPLRHFAAAVRLSRECRHEVGGPALWSEVVQLSELYQVPLVVQS